MPVWNDKTWVYRFDQPVADFRAARGKSAPGFCAELTGIDGRFVGGLRRFPGFRVRFRVVNASGTINFFRYAEIQKGASAYKMRGFVTRYGTTCGFQYYDTEAAAWGFLLIDASSSGEIDISFQGRHLYYAKEGSQGKTIYWNGSELVAHTFGFIQDVVQVLATPIVNATNGAIVESGESGSTYEYRVSARLGHLERGSWTPVEAQVKAVTVGIAPPQKIYLSLAVTVSQAEAAEYNTIEVYRSRSNRNEMYRVLHHHVPTATGNPNDMLKNLEGDADAPVSLGPLGGTITCYIGYKGTIASGTVLIDSYNDEQAVLQPLFDEETENAGPVPRGGRIFSSGHLVLKTPDGSEEGRLRMEVAYSVLHELWMETFPPLNFYRPPRVSDEMDRFIAAGDLIYGISRSRLFRFTKQGATVGIERVAHGWNLANRWAAAEVGSDFAMLGTSALVMIAGSTGNQTTVGIIERILTDGREWLRDKDDAFLVYDISAQVLFAVSPGKEEAIALWGTTSMATRLKDMPFVLGTSGPDPETGGSDRAWLVTSSGSIAVMDYNRESGWSGWQLGEELDNQFPSNGIFSKAKSGTSWSLSDFGVAGQPSVSAFVNNQFNNEFGSSPVVDNVFEGCFLYVFHAGGAISRRKVTASSHPSITLDTSLPVLAGDRWSFSPVPFEVVGWALSAGDDPRSPDDPLRRRVANGIAFDIDMLIEDDDYEVLSGPNRSMFGRIYKRSSRDPLVSVEIPVQDSPDLNAGAVAAAGGTLLPAVACLTSGMDFELTSIVASGSLEESRKDQLKR